MSAADKGAIRIAVNYADGIQAVFSKRSDQSWVHVIQQPGQQPLRVVGYKPADVLEVLGRALGGEVAKVVRPS
jgi:hypothetical protein